MYSESLFTNGRKTIISKDLRHVVLDTVQLRGGQCHKLESPTMAWPLSKASQGPLRRKCLPKEQSLPTTKPGGLSCPELVTHLSMIQFSSCQKLTYLE